MKLKPQNGPANLVVSGVVLYKDDVEDLLIHMETIPSESGTQIEDSRAHYDDVAEFLNNGPARSEDLCLSRTQGEDGIQLDFGRKGVAVLRLGDDRAHVGHQQAILEILRQRRTILSRICYSTFGQFVVIGCILVMLATMVILFINPDTAILKAMQKVYYVDAAIALICAAIGATGIATSTRVYPRTVRDQTTFFDRNRDPLLVAAITTVIGFLLNHIL